MTRFPFALALVAAIPLSAMAAPSEIDYSYVQGGYVSTKESKNSLTSNGGNARVSYALSDHFYGTAGYTRISGKDAFSESSIRNSDAEIGLGFHLGMFSRVDFFGEAAYLRGRASGDTNQSGYKVVTGVRGLLGDSIEGYFSIYIADGNSYGVSQIGSTAGLVFRFSKMWGVYAGADVFTDANHNFKSFNAGVRVSF